jgi:hypothetical protein
MLVLCAGLLPTAFAQPSRADLERLVAPVAQYPDDLLTPVLVASTYPRDVVEASRWLRSYPGLSGERAVQLAAQTQWDLSVQSLTAHPQVLNWMADNIRWTEDLGEVFLNYEPYVMDAVQAQRQRAWAAGTLRTTPQQVVHPGPVIVIRPARPHVVHIPYRMDWPRREVIVVRPHQPARAWKHEPRRVVVHREVRRVEHHRHERHDRDDRKPHGKDRDNKRHDNGHDRHRRDRG